MILERMQTAGSPAFRRRESLECAALARIWTAALAAFVLVSLPAAWASPTVTNVVATQRTDGSGLVDVYYALSGGSGPMMVSLTFSNDNGLHWNVLPTPSTLTGDAGPGITNGASRHIIWDAATDRAEVYWPQAKARVTASEIGQTVTFMLPGGVPLEMARIPAGSFWMGAPLDDWSQTNETPAHAVTFAQEFYTWRLKFLRMRRPSLHARLTSLGGVPCADFRFKTQRS